MIGKQNMIECAYSKSQSRYPNVPPVVPQARGPRGPYMQKPCGLGSILNYICHCERMCGASHTGKSKKKKYNQFVEINQTAEGTNKMFYWVIHDPENTDPRVQDIVCIDSDEKRPLKPAEVRREAESGKNEIYWQYISDMEVGSKSGERSGSHKKRSVKNRRPTAAAVKRTTRLKKHLRNKIKEYNTRDSSDENLLKFDFPDEIREPQRGDMICWMGKSKNGPLSGVRAIWEAEEITGEPGKICWLGREVTDRETDSALRYTNKSQSGTHSWKSRPGFCLPPISSLKQRPIDLMHRLSSLKPDSSSKRGNSSQGGNSVDDDKLLSISTYNIPSELLKTVSWQDFPKRR